LISLAHTDTGEKTAPAPVTPAPAEISETFSGRSDRWAVVLLNDDHHSVDYVVWALLKTVPELTETEAAFIMLEVHNTGKGVVTVCGRGAAEGYRASLRLLQLGCEIEPGW
jgi:ATP-dependent Clp protease adapter protein ClpS